MKKYPQAVCSLVINNSGLVLACSRKDNKEIFGLPGGKVDLTDWHLEDAARRELYEETGIWAGSGTPVFTAMCYGSDGKHYLTTTFIWNQLPSEPRQIEGEGLVAWVSTDVMCRLNIGKYKNFGIYNRKLFEHMDIYVPEISHHMQDVICKEYPPNQIKEV